jgi:3-phenylpropionate/trans-cinnamate dioxygenase ferredoxin subunit
MWHDAAALEELIEGQGVRVVLDDEPVLIVRLGGVIRAVDDTCSHEEQSLAGGSSPGGTEWECPHHGACFDLVTGRATRMPAVAPIRTRPVKVEAGRVWVLID